LSLTNNDTLESREAAFKVTVHPDLKDRARVVLDFLDHPDRARTSEVIKKNIVRTVRRVDSQGFRFILKRYHSPGIVNAIKYFVFQSRSSREWSAMQRFHELHIPTAQTIAFGETRRYGFLTDSFFAITLIEESRPFMPHIRELIRQNRWSDTARDDLFDRLARLTALIHDSSVFHADYHLGNVLVQQPKGQEPRLFVIDLHAVTFPRRLARKRILLNLARIAESLRSLEEGQVRRFLEFYLRRRPSLAADADRLEHEIVSKLASLDRRRLKSRTRRCLVRSSKFTRVRTSGWTMNLKRSFEPAHIVRALEIHDRTPHDGPGRLIPPSNKNKITAMTVEDAWGNATKLCVKEYRRVGPLRRLLPLASYGKRSWIAGHGLAVRGIATPETIAWVRGAGREFIVTTLIEHAQKLHAYAMQSCVDLAPDARLAFLRALALELAVFLSRAHRAGVCHHDLCEQNVLIQDSEHRRTILLVDLDTVTFEQRLSSRRIVKNLVQLGHLPGDVNVLLKARFLRAYLGDYLGLENHVDSSTRRKLLERVNRGILKRMIAKRERFLQRGDLDPHPIPSRLRRSWIGIDP